MARPAAPFPPCGGPGPPWPTLRCSAAGRAAKPTMTSRGMRGTRSCGSTKRGQSVPRPCSRCWRPTSATPSSPARWRAMWVPRPSPPQTIRFPFPVRSSFSCSLQQPCPQKLAAAATSPLLCRGNRPILIAPCLSRASRAPMYGVDAGLGVTNCAVRCDRNRNRLHRTTCRPTSSRKMPTPAAA